MMATTEERMKILKMIDEGKISAEEGAKLLSALSESRSRAMTGSGLNRGTGNARWLRVKVTDVASGRSKATVQIPIGLLDAGLEDRCTFRTRGGRRGFDPAHGCCPLRRDRKIGGCDRRRRRGTRGDLRGVMGLN